MGTLPDSVCPDSSILGPELPSSAPTGWLARFGCALSVVVLSAVIPWPLALWNVLWGIMVTLLVTIICLAPLSLVLSLA